MKDKILVIGASGQIGSELTLELRKVYGSGNVFAADIKQPSKEVIESGQFEILDVLDYKRLISFLILHNITQVYMLAAILSGKAEKLPLQAWDINMKGLLNVLGAGKEAELKKIFWPSSIAVFGQTTPKKNAPQLTVMEPTTIYGISKIAGERWCEYYNRRYGLDVRSIRYPGLISYKTETGGGTTDYAVEIFYGAIKSKSYKCFLKEDSVLPMMFMPDAIRGTLELMEADAKKLSTLSAYNLSALSFSPKQIVSEIKKHIPDFEIIYEPDFRQVIAETWPQTVDDSSARKDWGWKHEYDLVRMTEIMLKEIKLKLL